MSINLSSITLSNEAAFREIAAIISSSQVDYTKLIIEITETASLLNMENVLKWLDQLKRMGIRIALDDFGTGYSTLSLLNQLPIDVIKIDNSFVNMIANDKKDRLIIKNTISMAHDLNCRVVAEGIETPEQLDFLKESFCESGQGYLLCMPLPEDKVKRYLVSVTMNKL